jgi:DnaJ-class molecular chaperone
LNGVTKEVSYQLGFSKKTTNITFTPLQRTFILKNAAKLNSHYDLVITVKVLSTDQFQVDNNDIISNIEIDLITSMFGGEIEVDTIHGKKTLKIKPGTKNKDILRVNGFGIPTDGNHIFNISVKYPDNIPEFIEQLKVNNGL